MESENKESDSAYWQKLKKQADYLNSNTLVFWFCDILFTKLSTGIGIGPRPVLVGCTLLLLVYGFMHIGYFLTSAVRLPIILATLYLGHVHLIQPGDFLLNQAFELEWSHFFLLWLAMHFSFLFKVDRYPFSETEPKPQSTKHPFRLSWFRRKKRRAGKVVNIPTSYARLNR